MRWAERGERRSGPRSGERARHGRVTRARLLVPLAAAFVAVGLAGCSAPPGPRWAPPTPLPPLATDPTEPGLAGVADPAWVDAVSQASGIPARALAAYAGAAIAKAELMPECGLSWATLAGIGAVESDHGRHGGATMSADGTVSPAILGPVLDGGDTANIPDSDGGAFDGDATYDRAMGPMQFIPEAWANWGFDGNVDGVADPQNIDDAAGATANYLCRASDDLTTEAGWLAGIDAYNSADGYSDAVAAAAVAAARAAEQVAGG